MGLRKLLRGYTSRRRVASIHTIAEKAHSRRLVVASPYTNIPFIALRAVSRRAPAAFCRPIDTPAAKIYYEKLQLVAAELPENLVLCRDARLCRPTHYTG